MNPVKAKIIVITGPTSSGKSDAAIKLAKEFNGEIISADSRQIYRGMDIGSGKVSRDKKRETGDVSQITEEFISEGIQHYLIDVVNPNEEFNISHFKKIAQKAIEKILAKGKLPIICGGTGFWIKAITENITLPGVKPNKELRELLNQNSTEELFLKLKELDPERALNIDHKNKIRLIRAIEIATVLGKVPQKSLLINQQSDKYEFLKIGIKVEREILNKKIQKRLYERFDQGMIQEVEKLHAKGVSWEKLEAFGLEYRWIARYLQNKINLEEMKQKLYFDIIHYAKRQMTWLKKDKDIIWHQNYKDIKKDTISFLK